MLDRRLATIGIASAGALSLVACLRRIWAADFWWQNRAGAWILEHGWPSSDPFSYAAAGARWIELRWLYCVTQYGLFHAFGAPAVVLAKWLVVVAAFALVTRAGIGRRSAVWAGPVLVVALLTSTQRFFARPELVTFVFLALFVFLIDRDRRRGDRRIWLLPALQVVWVNAHTLFLFGPLLVGLGWLVSLVEPRLPGAATRARPRRLGLVLAATVLACLVNPWGVDGALFPLQLFRQIQGTAFKDAITEFRGPFDFEAPLVALPWFVALIGLCAATALANLRRLDPLWLVLCGSQLYLALLAIRNLPLFALAAVPFVLSNLERSALLERPTARRLLGQAGRVAVAGAIAVCLWYGWRMVTDRLSLDQHDTNQFGVGVARHRFPAGAVDFLDREGIDGHVLGGLLDNSYLIARGRQVFFDPRLEVYGERWFIRFAEACRAPAAFRAAVDEFDVRVVLAGLQESLVGLAQRDPNWRLVWFDEVAAVYLRRDVRPDLAELGGEEEAQVAAKIAASLGPARSPAETGTFERVELPRPWAATADFLLLRGRAELARPFVDDAATIDPTDPDAPLRRAALLEQAGRLDELAGLAAGREPAATDPRVALRVGGALFRLGRVAEALGWLERAVEADPGRHVVWGMIAQARAAGGDWAGAAAALERALALAPGEPAYLAALARIRGRQGHTDAAIAGLEQALAARPGDVSILRDLAVLHAAAGHRERALAYAEAALQRRPDDPELRRLRAGLEAPR